MEDYVSILKAFVNADIEFAVIGTWALKCYFPKEMENYPILDCDLVLNPDIQNIQKAFEELKKNGFRPSVWGKVFEKMPSQENLAGKFYMRAEKNRLRLDLTYECEWIEWEKMKSETVWVNEIPLASISHIKMLKEIKGQAKDWALIHDLFGKSHS